MNPIFQINGIPYLDWLELNHQEEDLTHIASFIRSWGSSAKQFSFQTSGSTGIPKNIEIKRSYLEHSAKATGKALELSEGDSALLCLPIQYIAGRMMLIRAMVLGLNLHVVKPQAVEIVKAEGEFKFSAMTPYQVARVMEINSQFLERIEVLIIGGGHINISLEHELYNLKTKCFATFGMTETVSHIALKEIKSENEASYVGLPEVYFDINDKDQLIINAPKWGVFNLLTNDVVELKSKVEFVWKGRLDNVINSGGVKVYPEKIEAVLSKQIDGNFFIVGIEDPMLGCQVVLIIEGNNQPLDFNVLSKFEQPKKVFYLEQFIYTKTGKIQRTETLSLI